MPYLGNCKWFRFGDKWREKVKKREKSPYFLGRNERAGQGFHTDPRVHRDPR